MQTNQLDGVNLSPNIPNIPNPPNLPNKEGNKGRFSLAVGSFKHLLKDKPKSKPFSYGINTKHPLDDYPVNSLFCFVEDDYAVIDSLAEPEKKIAMWR